MGVVALPKVCSAASLSLSREEAEECLEDTLPIGGHAPHNQSGLSLKDQQNGVQETGLQTVLQV